MVRNVKTGELFATFKYDGKDCADMGIYSVTSGAVYTMNIEPTFSDNTLEVPAYDGKYYYGTQITGQQFQFNCFCHDLLATEYDRMRAWLNPRKIGRLILSDQPYKYYLVKPVSVSTLGAYPLTTIQTPSNTQFGNYAPESVVYTGNFTVTFETIGSAYGYGFCYYRDDLIYDAVFVYGENYYYDAGLLYKDMCPAANWEIKSNTSNQSIPLYNPGSATINPRYLVTHEGTFGDKSFIQFTNNTAGVSTVIDVSNMTGNFTIDTEAQVLITVNDKGEEIQHYGRFTGPTLTLNPHGDIIDIPETFVENIDNTDLVEYDSFYIAKDEEGDLVVSINPKVLQVSTDFVGRYFSTNHNGGSKIVAVNPIKNTLTLDRDVLTYEIGKEGFACNYKEVDNDEEKIPQNPQLGDVYTINGVWYIYRYGEWQETSMFSSPEEFKNIYGDYQTIYRTFGATIVALDDLVITTGTNISYKDTNTTTQGSSVDAFTLKAEILPRYL